MSYLCRTRPKTAIGILMLAFLACGPGLTSGSSSTGLNNGHLFTAWNEAGPSNSGESFHLLTVVPGSGDPGSSNSESWGGTPDLMTFELSFQPAGDTRGPAQPPPIKYALELIENRTIRSAGREFDLHEGNLFVCVFSNTGAAEVVQLPERMVENLGAAELLRIFQTELGPDHPAQTVSLKQ